MTTTVTTELPKEQKEIIIQALINFEAQMEIFRKLNTEAVEDNFLRHDIHTLKSLMNYKVKIELNDNEHKMFTFNEKIDFPEWKE